MKARCSMRSTIAAVLLFGIFAAWSTAAIAVEPTDVRVNNFPDTQKVRGVMNIDGPVSHASFVKSEGLVLATSRRSELSELLYVTTLDTAGFTAAAVSLQGEVKSSNFIAGTVGVLLVPDEEQLLRNFRDVRLLSFPVETAINLKPGDSEYFTVQKTNQPLAFPRYRVYLYNTLNRNVEANVYIYLTN